MNSDDTLSICVNNSFTNHAVLRIVREKKPRQKKIVHKESIPIPTENSVPKKLTRDTPYFDQHREYETCSMVNFQQQMETEGISKNTAKFVINVKRTGTKTRDILTWNKWTGWCAQR